MKFHTSINYLLLFLLHIIPATTVPAYTPADRILLNCGASGIFNDTSHRSWVGDTDSKFMPENATISLASYMDPSVSPVPYHTARLFTNSFTYTFPISKGQKFLRLYFYPNIYSHQDTSTSLFSVSANSFNLLTNFSAFLYSQNSSQPSFMKEFIINIKDHSVKLALTFLPEPSSTGFVNGIEIVSIPDELYLRRNEVIKYVEENSQIFNLDGNTAFESLYRLNVGGGRVDIEYDSGMNRVWYPDDNYLVSKAAGKTLHADDNVEVTSLSHTAPDIVYKSARVTANNAIILNWEFPVDSGFYYLIRLHLCEFMPGVTKSKQRTFSISLNNIAADIAADVVLWAGGPLIPTFKDYVIWAPDYSGKQNLVLSVFPVNAQDPHNRIAFLNGLEIFKLNHTNGSLASANPEPAVNHFQLIMKEKKSRGLYVVISVTVTVVVGVLAVVGVLSFLIYQRLHKVKKQSYGSVAQSSFLPPSTTSRSTTGTTAADSHPWNSCRYFPLAEIKAATSNLDRNSIIGKGGFGCVYMGVIDDGATTVAIKRLNPSSNQGAREFLTEIHMLSKLRHLHLVSLIGYCDEEGEMILVYDYMAHGSLHDHLYSSHKPPLSWKQRLQISMGAAKGLHYLHTGTEHAIIHRDVKSTNILLDHNWIAKISDFGLSKMGESNDSFTHISTNIKGTFGYLDPKYLSTHQLTRKSDVYAFGVVLFELISGRAAVDVRLDEEQHSLAGWARFCVREGQVDGLIDRNLEGQISAGCLDVFVGIAGRCIHIQPLERPSMADVVMGLELAAALQETTVVEDDDNDAEGIHSDQSQVFVSMDVICGTNCSESTG
ncbi:receptor-like protein kinase FERONIA [Salvia splendens]|uniref:receptor-like protein kinase FERONIA n=1 Tax=Salvia splendens TaxID=180675 RepID=UPI001C2676CA|nr:receptor-like protein kinase FERONIA [Salvia splendens]